MIEHNLRFLTPVQADRLKEAEKYIYSDGALTKEIIRIKLTDPEHWHWNNDILYDRVKSDLSDAMATLCEQTSYAVTFDTAPYVAAHMARLGNVLHRAWREYVTEEVEANRARYLEEGWTLIELQRAKRDRELL